MASPLLIGACVVGLAVFYFVMFLLPDDAYGEEDVRIFSEEILRARNRTHVLVLGDIGRSPRMQNHALSLARRHVAVNLIGYVGKLVIGMVKSVILTHLESELHPEIAQKVHKWLTVHPISKPPKALETSNKSLFLLFGPLKLAWQFWNLYWILSHEVKPAKTLLVQVCNLQGTFLKLIIVEPTFYTNIACCFSSVLATQDKIDN
jgi:beta-1,4-mannosyltransferase